MTYHIPNKGAGRVATIAVPVRPRGLMRSSARARKHHLAGGSADQLSTIGIDRGIGNARACYGAFGGGGRP